jgi:hypothetical protein
MKATGQMSPAVGRLGMPSLYHHPVLHRRHSLAKCPPVHRKGAQAIKYICETKLDPFILNLRPQEQARFTSCF